MKLSQVYRKAIELLNERGWVKGTVRNSNGMCLYGACAIADTGTAVDHNLSEYRRSYSKYIDQVVPKTPGGHADGVGFNDGVAVTKEQVQEVLWLAAQKAEAAGD